MENNNYWYGNMKLGWNFWVNTLIVVCLWYLNWHVQPLYAKNLYHLSELSKESESSDPSHNYVIGMDGLYLYAKPRFDYADIFVDIKPGSNFYIGYSWEDDIILEIGYLSTNKKSKSTPWLSGGTSFLGSTGALATIVTGQVRIRNTHVDLNFITHFYKSLNVVTALGIGNVRTNVKIVSSTTDLPRRPGETTINPVVIPKNKAIFRAGLGFFYELNNKVGCRIMLYFDQYSTIKYQSPEIMNKPFHNAYSVLIGICSKLI